jgi:hypothetical protein
VESTTTLVQELMSESTTVMLLMSPLFKRLLSFTSPWWTFICSFTAIAGAIISIGTPY